VKIKGGLIFKKANGNDFYIVAKAMKKVVIVDAHNKFILLSKKQAVNNLIRSLSSSKSEVFCNPVRFVSALKNLRIHS